MGQDRDINASLHSYDFGQIKGLSPMEAAMAALWLPEDQIETNDQHKLTSCHTNYNCVLNILIKVLH